MPVIAFLTQQEAGLSQLTSSYNWILVFASYLIAAIAAFSGIRLARYAEHGTRYVWRWLIVGGVTMGFGVWSMHFIGMLAYRLPIPVGYDLGITILSVIPAIIGCSAGLALLRRDLSLNDDLRRLVAGAIIGAGIGVMHYSGMAAMRMEATLFYDKHWFYLSILIAVILGIIGVYAEKLRDFDATGWLVLPFQVASAAILGLSISGMHYVAMQATICIPAENGAVNVDGVLSPIALSINVSLASVVIAALSLIAVKVDARMKGAQRQLQLTQERMFAAIESINDGFLLFDENGTLMMHNSVFAGMYPKLKHVLFAGASYEQILRVWASEREDFPDGLDREGYIQRCLESFNNQNSPVDGTDEDKLFDGRWAVIRQSPISVGGLVSIWHDVTAIKKQQDIYKELALTDGLTKLPNRDAFMRRLGSAIKRNERNRKKIALMFVDLDKFKPINDTFGHDAGDYVLKVIAERLSALMRKTDLVARIGGDEFVILLEEITQIEDIERIAGKVLEMIRKPIEFKGNDCSVGGSIGISVGPEHGTNEEALIKAADEVMYLVKQAGRNDFRIFGSDKLKESEASDTPA